MGAIPRSSPPWRAAGAHRAHAGCLPPLGAALPHPPRAKQRRSAPPPRRRRQSPCHHASPQSSAEVDEDPSSLHFHWVGLEIDADGSALGRAGAIVEPPIVLRTFNDIAHHQAVREVHLLVRAKTVGRKIPIVRRAIDREGSTALIEPDYVFFIDGVDGTDFKPRCHLPSICVVCTRPWSCTRLRQCRASAAGSRRAAALTGVS